MTAAMKVFVMNYEKLNKYPLLMFLNSELPLPLPVTTQSFRVTLILA